MHRLETGIPIPEDVLSKKNHRKYPFDKMKVGDSFAFDLRKRSTVRNSTKSHARRHGVKFHIGVGEDGEGRIWRIA